MWSRFAMSPLPSFTPSATPTGNSNTPNVWNPAPFQDPRKGGMGSLCRWGVGVPATATPWIRIERAQGFTGTEGVPDPACGCPCPGLPPPPGAFIRSHKTLSGGRGRGRGAAGGSGLTPGTSGTLGSRTWCRRVWGGGRHTAQPAAPCVSLNGRQQEGRGEDIEGVRLWEPTKPPLRVWG